VPKWLTRSKSPERAEIIIGETIHIGEVHGSKTLTVCGIIIKGIHRNDIHLKTVGEQGKAIKCKQCTGEDHATKNPNARRPGSPEE